METPEHFPASTVIPETFVPLDIPVPDGLATAFGYPGPARHVAFFWQPIGDELCYDDGRLAGTGEWHPFLTYRSHRHVAPALEPWNLGYSDQDADHWLILDRHAAQAWIAAVQDARAFLSDQHPDLAPMRLIDLRSIRDEIRSTLTRRSVSLEELADRQSRQRELLRRMLRFCDAWQDPAPPSNY